MGLYSSGDGACCDSVCVWEEDGLFNDEMKGDQQIGYKNGIRLMSVRIYEDDNHLSKEFL